MSLLLDNPTPQFGEIRETYGHALEELGGLLEEVVALDADVSSSTRSDYFAKAFPHRFFNVGIAELHLVGMAAGLAATGLIPFANCFGVFMALRAGDMIQSIIAHDKLNVKLAAAYTGYSGGQHGSSHHAISDIAQMRATPNMTIFTVSDIVSTRKAVFAAAAYQGPVYLRLLRARVETVYSNAWDYVVGGSNLLLDGSDLAIVATGPMVQKALHAARALAHEGIFARVIDAYCVKPLDDKRMLEAAVHTGALVTAEEHNRHGGLGGAVAELLSKHLPTPLEMVAVEDHFSQSGTYEQLNEKYGLTVENIIAKAKAVLKRKRR